jgi:hypothetical protein
MAKSKAEPKIQIVCASLSANDNVTNAALTMTAAYATKLQLLRTAIRQGEILEWSVYALECWDSSPVWGSFADVGPGGQQGWFVVGGNSSWCLESVRTVCGTVKATEDGVYWEATEKHDDSGVYFESQRLTWDIIDRLAVAKTKKALAAAFA